LWGDAVGRQKTPVVKRFYKNPYTQGLNGCH
jgi:hypothetical protein